MRKLYNSVCGLNDAKMIILNNDDIYTGNTGLGKTLILLCMCVCMCVG